MICEINCCKEFSKKLSTYKENNYVFRGQVKDYPFSTSFERNQCHPGQKAKWEFYCYNALKMILGAETYNSMSYNQMLVYVDSLLQHYGWRSMQIDITKKIDVAVFFSCYSYKERCFIQLVEDCSENGLMEKTSVATYEKSTEKYGYIYVFDLDCLKRNSNIVFTDLTAGLINPNCRPVKQSGCTVSSFPKMIDGEMSSALVEILKVKSDILQEYCDETDMTQDYLFPSEVDDYIYSFLLSLPSKELIANGNKPSGIYLKELNIPEYHYIFRKIHSSAKAFYSTFWIFDNLELLDEKCSLKDDFVYYKSTVDGYFHYFSKEGDYLKMPEFIALINQQKNIILEFDNIFRHYSTSQTEYQKGVHYTLIGDLIMVAEIVTQWTGRDIAGFGELMPRYYQIISDNKVKPIRIKNDCPCNDDDRHLHRLLIGKYFAQMLNEGYLKSKQEKKNVFIIS